MITVMMCSLCFRLSRRKGSFPRKKTVADRFLCSILSSKRYIYEGEKESLKQCIGAKGDLLNNLDKILEANKVKASSSSDNERNSKIISIYKKHNADLHNFLLKRLDKKEDADDVAQEVYFRLLRHPKLNELDLSLSLLLSIVNNLIIDIYRSRNLRKTDAYSSLDELRIPSYQATPEQIVKSKQGIDFVNKVFERLGRKYRRAFVLSRFKGLTYDEIAKDMNVSKRTVNKYISRVLFELNEIFEESI
jgi:RNA polymerase sigma factor (sigma-70 family)